MNFVLNSFIITPVYPASIFLGYQLLLYCSDNGIRKMISGYQNFALCLVQFALFQRRSLAMFNPFFFGWFRPLFFHSLQLCLPALHQRMLSCYAGTNFPLRTNKALLAEICGLWLDRRFSFSKPVQFLSLNSFARFSCFFVVSFPKLPFHL